MIILDKSPTNILTNEDETAFRGMCWVAEKSLISNDFNWTPWQGLSTTATRVLVIGDECKLLLTNQ